MTIIIKYPFYSVTNKLYQWAIIYRKLWFEQGQEKANEYAGQHIPVQLIPNVQAVVDVIGEEQQQ